jgi:hypothetical protein
MVSRIVRARLEAQERCARAAASQVRPFQQPRATRGEGEQVMRSDVLALNTGLTRTLCAVVFIVMAVALVYTAWIAVINFSRIHV